MLQASERETQLRHEVGMKRELLRQFFKDEESDEGSGGSLYSSFEEDFKSDTSCKDESIITLQSKCKKLEEHNSHLVFEALKLKEETVSVEQREHQLVNDCVKQLGKDMIGEAKEQISLLTEEISSKAEDNIRQQDEITQLISTVLELQRKHKELSHENVELHSMLDSSKSSQTDLKGQISTLFEKYDECFQILVENQREMKHLKTKVEATNTKVVRPKDGTMPLAGRHVPVLKNMPTVRLRYAAKDSLAEEIEEQVRRDLMSSQEKKKHTSRVMETVRAANAPKKPPSVRRSPSLKHSKPKFIFQEADEPSEGPEEEEEAKRFSRVSSQTDFGMDTYSPVGSPSSYGRYRGMHLPEKLQIVKPMEGSLTLHKWQQLASPNLSGLSDERPGVHVKGETDSEKGEDNEVHSDTDDEMFEEDDHIMIRIRNPSTTSQTTTTSSSSTTATSSSTVTTCTTTTAYSPRTSVACKSKLTSLINKQGIQAAPVPLFPTTAVRSPALSTRESPRTVPVPSTGTDLLSKFFKVTTSGLKGLGATQPITTVASSTTTSLSFSPSGKALSRSLSSENFLTKYSLSDDDNGVGTGMIKRSSSGSSLQRLESAAYGLGQDEFGGSQPLQRRNSHSSLTELVKAFDFVSTVGTYGSNSSSQSTLRSSHSIDSPEEDSNERRSSFTMGESPPSPSSFDTSGIRKFFGFSSSKPSKSNTDTALSEKTQATLSKFGLLRGSLRRTRSLEGASSNIPVVTNLSQQQPLTNSSVDVKEKQMKSIKRVMKHDGFGGLGLM